MTCTKPIDPDEGNMNQCGDEGELCFDCRCAEYKYWRELYDRTPLSERDPEAYRIEMIDAGRHVETDDYLERGDEHANQ